MVAEPLKKEEAEVSLFGDSPLEERQGPDVDMLEDDDQNRKTVGNKKEEIEAESIENQSRSDLQPQDMHTSTNVTSEVITSL